MTAQEPKKSNYITDEDRKVAKPWKYDQASVAKMVKEEGGIYEGILEAVQNAIDSPEDPDNDINRIDILIPTKADEQYDEVVAIVRDQGGSITKDYGGDIEKFLNATKAISPKPRRKGFKRFGQGMGQYSAVSQDQIIDSFDTKKNVIYRIPIVQLPDGQLGYGHWIFEVATPEVQAKYELTQSGSDILFVNPYPDMPRPDPMLLARKIRDTFGWRLMLQPNTDLWINHGIHIDLPDWLKDKQPRFIRRLKRQKVDGKNVDAEVTGVIYYDPKGKGILQVHAGGYYIGPFDTETNKRFSGAVNIDEMPTDRSRRVMIHEAMRLDFKEQMKEETKHYPDMPSPTDEGLSEKNKKILTEGLNRMLEPFNLPKIFIENYKEQKRKREEQMRNPNGKTENGYRKPEEKEPQELEMCELCDHLKKKSKEMRAKCSCKCHETRPKGPDKEKKKVGDVGDTVCLTETIDPEDLQKRHEIKINFSDDPSPDRFVILRTGYVQVETKHDLFNPLVRDDKKDMMKVLQNLAPFLATQIMDLKFPTALTDKTLAEFRKLEEDFITQMVRLL